MNSNKFLGICILLSSMVLGGAILYHANVTKTAKSNIDSTVPLSNNSQPGIGRFQFHPSNPPGVLWKIDTVTGKITTGSG
jgi:hypothetical protein